MTLNFGKDRIVQRTRNIATNVFVEITHKKVY